MKTNTIPNPYITPSSPREQGEAVYDLNRELIQNQSATFFLKVNSNIMKEAGICQGDTIIIDRSLKASNHQIIIALLDGEMLIRRFEAINNRIHLLPANNQLSSIQIEPYCERFSIFGVVTFVIRNMKKEKMKVKEIP